MDQLISDAQINSDVLRGISLWQFFFAMLFSLTLNLILAKCYQYFNTNYTNPSSTIRTIVFIGLIITLIMVIIGSNIARAFALVGAMSIVRFRNPLKDPKDLTYIFASIAIGMASGTFFYEYAIIFLAFFISANYLMKYLVFKKDSMEFRILKIKFLNDDMEFLETLFKKSKIQSKLVNSSNFIENDRTYIDHVYELKFKNLKEFENIVKMLIDSNKFQLDILAGDPESGN